MRACPNPLPEDEIVEKYRFDGYKFQIFVVETMFGIIWFFLNANSIEDSTEDLGDGTMTLIETIGIKITMMVIQFAAPMGKIPITY